MELRCLTVACVPSRPASVLGGQEGRGERRTFRFKPARSALRRPEAGELRQLRRVWWPPLDAISRLSATNTGVPAIGSAPGAEFQATVTPVPEPSYRVPAGLLGAVLFGGAAALLALPAGLLAREVRRRRPEREEERELLPLERALLLVESARDRGNAEQQREALEALAFELDAETRRSAREKLARSPGRRPTPAAERVTAAGRCGQERRCGYLARSRARLRRPAQRTAARPRRARPRAADRVRARVLEARSIDPRRAPLVPSGTTGILVLDLSASVYEDAFGQTIRKLARAGEETGVVAFSDAGYELLPPGTPARELLPLLRFFNPDAASSTATLPVDPWQDFRAGTRISEGLKVAHDALLREHARKGSIVLVSDLEVLPDEIVQLADVAADLRRNGVRLRIVPLFPTPEKYARIKQILRRVVVPAGVLAGLSGRRAREAKPEVRGAVDVPADRHRARVAARSERGPAVETGAAAMRRRWAIRVAAVLAVPAAVVLVLLALDVLRVPRELAADDVRFQAAPRVPRALWGDLGFLPGSPGVRLLGVRDDVASRETLGLYARLNPSKMGDPEEDALRGRVQLEVTLRARENARPEWRSRQLNLFGVLTMSRWSTSGHEQEQILSRALGAFQSAIEVDPSNVDAKRNLEILLRRPEAAQLPPNDPSQGGAQGRVSGQGRSGSGY